MRNSVNPSVWQDESGALDAMPLLRGGLETEVCVVGGGIAGLTTAYLLACAGKQVVVIEAGEIGSGETMRSSAHLATAMDRGYVEIERIHGEERARVVGQSQKGAIYQIAETIQREQIECGFVRLDGYLFESEEDRQEDGEGKLLDEWRAARRAGIFEAKLVDGAPLRDFDTGPALLFPRQAQFNPVQYLVGLKEALVRQGGRVYAHTKATKIKGGEDAFVETQEGRVIRANHVVIATNVPINDLMAIHTKQAPYRTYMLAAKVPKGSIYRALYWDTAEPFHYARLLEGADGVGEDLLLVGGEDHKTGQEDDAAMRYRRLEHWARERFPMMGAITHRWSGQIIETVDGLAFMGHNPMDEENVYVITGDCGTGLTHGTIGASLVSDLIMGVENPREEVYDPARKRVSAAGKYVRENLNVMGCYTDYVTTGDVAEEAEIPPGEGAIVRYGMKKLAVFRDGFGECHYLSPVCTHMKCLVHWNTMEKTWDCPCHGSRFNTNGEVLNGPAVEDLKEEPAPEASEVRLPKS